MSTTTVTPSASTTEVTRLFEVRAASTGTDAAREFTGIAVPYGVETEIWPGWSEIIEPGAVEPADNVMLFRDHTTPIGRIVETAQTDEGFVIRGRFSETPAADETLTLIRDGVLTKLSIRFRQIEYSDDHDDDGTITRHHTRIEVSEVSVVPFPAYPDAQITEVRNRKDTPMGDTTSKTDDLTEIRSQLDDMRRDILALDQTATTPPPEDTRSAGAVLKALVAGDADTVETVNKLHTSAREWDGTTVENGGKSGPAWARNLIRLVDNANPLATLFAQGPLPSEGMTVEYGQLKTTTIKVVTQTKEGDDLPKGKVEIETKSAPVATYGGYTSLSRQAIDRSRVNMVDLSVRALAIEAGKAAARDFAKHLKATITARAAAAVSLGSAMAAAKWTNFVPATIDAAAAMADEGLSLDGLIVDLDAFKAIATLETSTGTPLMNVHGSGVNQVGSVNLTTPSGQLMNILVVPDLKTKAAGFGAGVSGCYFNRDAIRVYRSPLVQLQDERVINLTKDYSVYFYAAIADEIPAGIVPLKAGVGSE